MSKLEIEIGDTVKIAESSKYYDKGASNPTCEGVYNKTDGVINLSHRVDWVNGVSDWYNLHDLILIKKGKTMQFTKSDLKTGMFVKQRDGTYSIFLKDMFSETDDFMMLSSYEDNLKHNGCPKWDIMFVYKAEGQGPLSSYLEGEYLTPIWERIEQTEAQKEMEVLQEQAKALQEQITKLQGKL
jgi:hypothetical protein